MTGESIRATAAVPFDKATSTTQERKATNEPRPLAEKPQLQPADPAEQPKPQGPQREQPSFDEVRSKFAESLKNIQQRGYLRELSFDYEVGDNGDVLVKVLDAQTEEVIRQVPPEAQRQFAERLDELAGLLFDQQG